jgi:hypothetical protein
LPQPCVQSWSHTSSAAPLQTFLTQAETQGNRTRIGERKM